MRDTKSNQPNVFIVFCSRIWNEENVFHNLVSESILNGFCIINLTFFFMVRINIDMFKSRTMIENNPKSHSLLKPTFLSWQMATLRIAKIITNLISSSGHNQYRGYTTSNASIKNWAKNWLANFVISLLLTFAYCCSIDATTFSHICLVTKPNASIWLSNVA